MDKWLLWATEPESLRNLALRSAHLGLLTGGIPLDHIDRISASSKHMLQNAALAGYEPTVRVPARGMTFEGAYKENVRLLPGVPSTRAIEEGTWRSARPANYEYIYLDDYQGSTRLNIVARYPWKEYGDEEMKNYLSKLIDNIGRKDRYTSINYVDTSLTFDRSQFARKGHLLDNLSVTKEIAGREVKPFAFHAFEDPQDVVSLHEYMGSFNKPNVVGDSRVLAGMRRTVTTFEDGISTLRDTLTGAEFLPEILL